MNQVIDVAVIGGGINGCGIAADAAMRGLSVVLLEKDDLAGKTSSSSTKLIHGGLRYLEQYHVSMVKKSLTERQILLDMAPHLVFPRPFVLPCLDSSRPDWLVRAGLFLYDHLNRNNKLPGSKTLRRSTNPECFSPLTDRINKGFLYYDACTDDARLTICNALQAKAHGARILTQTELLTAKESNGIWQLDFRDQSGRHATLQAKALVNATGPWVESTSQQIGISCQHKLSLVKGSHIVVPRLYEGQQAYLLQHEDKRVVFVVPWEGYSMIGTTDILLTGTDTDVEISAAETDYLLNLVARYFRQSISVENIVTSWSGIRPLLAGNDDTPQTLSRDYVYQYSNTPAPAVTIYGGKLTTYRQLARDAVDELRAVFPDLSASATSTTPLPGAVFGDMSWKDYCVYAKNRYRWLDNNLLSRWLHSYGTRTEVLLQDCGSMSQLGQDFGHGLSQREVDFLLAEEWATCSDDILWRRTRLGLDFSVEMNQKLADYCQIVKS